MLFLESLPAFNQSDLCLPWFTRESYKNLAYQHYYLNIHDFLPLKA